MGTKIVTPYFSMVLGEVQTSVAFPSVLPVLIGIMMFFY